MVLKDLRWDIIILNGYFNTIVKLPVKNNNVAESKIVQIISTQYVLVLKWMNVYMYYV